jgi:N-acetylmuramoyl-L-alanine amidase
MVEDRYVAWHAGKSKWKNCINLNNKSLGIELVNKGHQYGYQSFTLRQIKSLIQLCKILKENIQLKKKIF